MRRNGAWRCQEGDSPVAPTAAVMLKPAVEGFLLDGEGTCHPWLDPESTRGLDEGVGTEWFPAFAETTPGFLPAQE